MQPILIRNRVLRITEDRLRLCLFDQREAMRRRGAWAAPLALSIALAAALVVCDFRDIVFEAEVWRGLFINLCAASFLWSCFTAVRAWRVRDITEESFLSAWELDHIWEVEVVRPRLRHRAWKPGSAGRPRGLRPG